MTMDDKQLAKELAGVAPTPNNEKEQSNNIKAEKSTKESSIPSFRRQITVLGMGDGGCKMASDIGLGIQGAITVGYNLSKRNEDLFALDKFISAESEDGSGKDREYAKSIVKDSAVLRTILQNTINDKSEIFITTQSTGGGTGCGSGPKASAEMADVLVEMYEKKKKQEPPVILIGAFPKITEDKASIFNTLSWQDEVNKIELPYMVFNNSRVSESIAVTHETVNAEIVRSVKVINGASFKKTEVSSMDSKDFLNLLRTPGRLNIYYSTRRPKQNESLDDFIINMMNESTQEPPLAPTASALLVRGPAELIRNMNDDLTALYEKLGDSDFKYMHIEVSSDVEISFITAGSKIPISAIEKLQTRYDEIEYARSKQEDVTVSLDIENPFKKEKVSKRGSNI